VTDAPEPVDVTISFHHLDSVENKNLDTPMDTMSIGPTRGADWLQLVLVQIRPDRVVTVVVSKDPHTPLNRLTVLADGSATFTH
jgi:hypothetical protein